MADSKDKSIVELPGGQSDLSRLYARVDKDEPSAGLDKTILEAAKADVHAGPRASGPFGASWYVPVSLAAVLVLAVGVVMTLEKETGQEAWAPQEYKPQVQPEPESSPVTSVQKNKEAADRLRAPAASGIRRVAPATVPGKAIQQEIEPAAEDAAQPEMTRQAPAKREYREAPQAPEPAQAVTPASATEMDDTVTEDKKSGDSEKPGTATGIEDSAKPARKPEEWLESIRELANSGRLDLAKQQYAEFRRQYPGYPVDNALQEILK